MPYQPTQALTLFPSLPITCTCQVSEEELGALKQRVSRMTLPALNIVAAVVGAPSTQDFVDSMQVGMCKGGGL